MDTVREGESGVNGESSADPYSLPCVRWLAGERLLCSTKSSA